MHSGISSVQFSCSLVSDSLRPHELQHARPPCPSPTPGVHSDSRPLSQWCHPAISSSVVPLLLLPPIPLSIRVFSNESTLHMWWPKYWSFSFSIIPSKEIPGPIQRSKLKVACSWEWDLAMTHGDQWTDGNKDHLEDTQMQRLLRPKPLSYALAVYNVPLIRLNPERKIGIGEEMNEIKSPLPSRNK